MANLSANGNCCIWCNRSCNIFLHSKHYWGLEKTFWKWINLYFYQKGKILGNYRAVIAKKTDRRVRLLEELISSMRIVKMYVWEGFFLKKLMKFRKGLAWELVTQNKISFYFFNLLLSRKKTKWGNKRKNYIFMAYAIPLWDHPANIL